MVENSVLRANARKQLGGNIFAQTWLFMLLAILVVNAIEGLSLATAIGYLLVGGPLTYGLYRMQVNVVTGKKPDFADLFTGFTENFGTSCILYILETIFIVLWSMLFFIPGVIKSYSYAMSKFIAQDNKEKDWSTCHRESIEMMKGHKWQLFVLDLSFIGWYLLGALCFGVGTLFVLPYHFQARANFYMALKAELGDSAATENTTENTTENAAENADVL